MATIVVDGNGNTLGEVAPDLGKAYGSLHRGSNVLKSSKTTEIASQDFSRCDTKRLLQQALGLNPLKEMVEFFDKLDADSKKEFLRVWKVLKGTLNNKAMATSLGLMANQDVIKREGVEVGKLKDDLDAIINKANNEINQIKGALSGLTEKLKNTVSSAQIEAAQSLKDILANAGEQITSFINSHTARVEEMESRIKEMLAKATVTTLSSKYDEKRKALNRNYWWAKGIFYVCLCAFCGFGLYTFNNVSTMVGGDIAEKIVKAVLKNAPLYLPLFWFTCHMNKLMNQNRRLMEEYAHKVAVAQTYVGMAEQVEELSKRA